MRVTGRNVATTTIAASVIAAPPRRGVAERCQRSARGATTSPIRRAAALNTGVVAADRTAAAITKSTSCGMVKLPGLPRYRAPSLVARRSCRRQILGGRRSHQIFVEGRYVRAERRGVVSAMHAQSRSGPEVIAPRRDGVQRVDRGAGPIR